MDGFMTHVLAALEEHGSRAVRVFPPPAGVLLAFAERLANDVVRIYHCMISVPLANQCHLGRRIHLPSPQSSSGGVTRSLPQGYSSELPRSLADG